MRYALGVGVGTPIVVLLWRTYKNTLPANTLIAPHFTGSIAALFWAAAGTAYCYVASVPMLTLHSTRSVLRRTTPWVIACFSSIVAILVAAALCDFLQVKSKLAFGATGFLVLVSIAGLQLFMLCKVLLSMDQTHDFYDKLSKKRPNNDELVESYRHMREHANSISIVVFELILAFILWSLRPVESAGTNVMPFQRVGLILAVWLTPSALVWLVGSSLERHLSRSN